jgi:penicillin-binding protein 2
MASMFEDGEERPQGRIRFFQFLMIAIFVLYALRLFDMQVISGEKYRRRSYNITKRTAVIPARRGEIYDRNFTEPLVINEDSFAVNLTPAEIPREQIPEIMNRLSELLGIPQREIEGKIPPQYYGLYQPIEITTNIPFETIAALSVHADSLPGLSWQAKPARNYGNIGSLSHIVGYVGGITRDELIQMYNEGYQQGDLIGKMGIERQYDSLLRGREGSETRTVDVRGRRMADDDRVLPEMGKNLVLTIDRDLQNLAEKALGERIGSVVVMKPNGEILAMVSYPWYDPHIFNRRNVTDEYQRLINNPNKPFLNRAIQSSYPPASTFKLLMTTSLLMESKFNPEQRISCVGHIDYGQRKWNCWSVHGAVNLQQALANSCDIYFWITGREQVGIDRIVQYSNDFGYGKVTGVDLPGEVEGFIPTAQWKQRIYHEPWVLGDTMNTSIGQGYSLVTPLQLTNAVALLINDGIAYRPRVLKEVRDPVSGALEQTVASEIINDVRNKIKPQVFDTVRRHMRSVVTEGSARNVCNIKSVEMAGKTGTAEVGYNKDEEKYHYWFTGYGPYDPITKEEKDNQIIVTVMTEATAQFGDWWPPYATSIIFQGKFANQSYEQALASLGLQYYAPAAQGRRE